jgi:hypothetical protein
VTEALPMAGFFVWGHRTEVTGVIARGQFVLTPPWHQT